MYTCLVVEIVSLFMTNACDQCSIPSKSSLIKYLLQMLISFWFLLIFCCFFFFLILFYGQKFHPFLFMKRLFFFMPECGLVFLVAPAKHGSLFQCRTLFRRVPNTAHVVRILYVVYLSQTQSVGRMTPRYVKLYITSFSQTIPPL